MHTIKPNQTLADVAVQRAGTMEAMFDIALANGIGITEDLQPGSTLEIPEGIALDKRNLRIIADKKIEPGSGTTPGQFGGIGYMIIEKTFIVS